MQASLVKINASKVCSFHLFQLKKTNKPTDFCPGAFHNCQVENQYHKLSGAEAEIAKETFKEEEKKIPGKDKQLLES